MPFHPLHLHARRGLVAHRDGPTQGIRNGKLPADEGLAQDIIDAIANRERPAFKNKDEEIVYNFVTELHETRKVSDATFDATRDLLGEAGVVELIVVCGHYSVVSMVLNTFQIEVPGGGKPLPLPGSPTPLSRPGISAKLVM